MYRAGSHGRLDGILYIVTPFKTRWVFTNKGDTERLFIRARLVSQEMKKTTKMDLTGTSVTFAATPPVEGFRFLLSKAMTGEKKKSAQEEMVIGFFDISRAHFQLPVRRKVAIRVPHGDSSCPSGVAMLNRAKYGTKDAAQCFDLLLVLATRTQIAEFNDHLSKHLLVKHMATLGPRPQLLDSCEVRFLNRVLQWIVPPFGKAPERIELEADPRHAELLIPNSGLQSNSKGVNTPGERPRDSLRTVQRSPQDATSYRSNVMRLA